MESVDLARLLLDLLVVLAAARLAAEVAERLGIPAVLGEIVAGILVGPSVLGLVELGGERGVSLGMLAELGVLLLLAQVGMEMDLAELGRVGRASMLVAVIGVAVPFAAGAAAGVGLGWETDTAIFLGAALTATSVGITARVFGDLHALATTEARVVLGAAVADDVLGLIILTVVVKVVTGDSVSVGVVASTILAAVVFLVLAGLVGIIAVPPTLGVLARGSRTDSTLTVAALVIVLGLAVLADAAQLAFIIGAFMAGLAISRSDHQERIARDLNSVGGVLIPVFFVLIGVNADLEAMLQPNVLLDAAVLLAIAIAGKLVSAFGAVGIRVDRVLVGIGMIPRGEVGLIFASIGLAQGVLDDELYGALLLVILVTTIVTPPLLRRRITAAPRVDVERLDELGDPEPPTGWVTVHDGVIRLTAAPPSSALVQVAIQTAARAAEGRPGDDLLSWFADRRDVELSWTEEDTDALLRVLPRGNPRAVRFLDVTGVLERGLPTVAGAVARRRADPSELDPARVLRFPVVARLGELLVDSGPSLLARDRIREATIAGLVFDVLGPDAIPPAIRLLLLELGVDDPSPVEHVLTSSALLRAGARDVDGYSESELLQLATHIGSGDALEVAYLLAVAGASDERHRDRLDELHALVAGLLDHPELLGSNATSIVESRRRAAEQLATEPAAVDRLRAAPASYLLAHDPEELARQARLVEPLPGPASVRVAVSPEGTPDHWIVDVACRDRDALLAHLASALNDAGCDIAGATLATWPDGAVVDTFLVRSAVRPRASALAERMDAGLRGPVRVEPAADLAVEFDNDSLPWHTACTVTGRNRPGTLASIAVALAASGVTIHSARVASSDERLVDRFAISDRLGRKLDERALDGVRAALAGTPTRRTRFRARR